MNIDKIKTLVVKYYYFVIIFILIVVIIFLVLNKKEVIITNEVFKECEPLKTIKVDIKGSIQNPGVYEVKENDRVIDVIIKSGGLKENADTSTINLSKVVSDAMVIYVYSIEEINSLRKGPETIVEYIEKECNCPTVDNDACLDSKEIVNNYITNYYNDDNKVSEENSSSLISINKATKEELMTLPNIGESKANNIIEYRKSNKFEKIEDIMNVSGIGNSVFEKIKDYISI